MTKAEFIGALTEKLLAAGISPAEFEPDLAAILAQTDKLKGEQFETIFYNDNIVSGFASTITDKVLRERGQKNQPARDGAQISSPQEDKTKTFSTVDGGRGTPADAPTAPFEPVSRQGVGSGTKKAVEKKPAEKKPKPKKVSVTPKFILIASLASPLVLVAFILLGVIITIPYIVVSALICALVAAMCSLVAAGAAGTLVGVIYGVSKLFVSTPIGLYETGLGLVILGISGGFAILSFNASIRYLPKLYKYLNAFAAYLVRLTRAFTDDMKRRCGGK